MSLGELLVKNQALGFFNRSFSNNLAVALGDSRLAQQYLTTGRTKAFNMLTQMQMHCGQRLRVVLNLAQSGKRSDEYLSTSNVNAAFATKAMWLIVYGVVNDIGQNAGNTDYWTVYIKPVVQRWIAQGRKVILITETGSNNFGISGSTYIAPVHKYNMQIKQFCKNEPNALLFDAASLVMTRTTGMQISPTYSSDGTHINLMAGGVLLGQNLATLVQDAGITPVNKLVYEPSAVYNNGAIQWFSNPLFLNTAAGTGFISGTVPAGLSFIIAGTTGATATSTVTTGQVGNDWNLAITATGSGVIKLAFDISNIESSGDKFFANARFRVASGSSGFQWASTYIESNRNSTTNWVEDGYTTTSDNALPSGTYDWVSETDLITISSGTRGWMTMYINVYFASAGSATLTISQLGLWRINSY